jgi:hypothetical protein
MGAYRKEGKALMRFSPGVPHRTPLVCTTMSTSRPPFDVIAGTDKDRIRAKGKERVDNIPSSMDRHWHPFGRRISLQDMHPV